jgi:hypothetical protein
VVDVGVMIYSTVPAVALLGLVSVWFNIGPDPALAPVILPVMAPIVHAKVDGVLEVSARLGLVLLQMASVAPLVTTGVGLTVTVIVNGEAGVQLPVVDDGVTMYSTVPAVALPGLVNTWLIVLPDPAVAPVIPPVTLPIVHAKLLAVVAVREMLGLVLLQIATVEGLVIAGVGFTVTVIV